MTPFRFSLLGSGQYSPCNSVASTCIDARLGLAPGTTEARHGLVSRHWATPNESSLYMARQAVDKALEQAGMSMCGVDCVIHAGCLVPQIVPNTASLLLDSYGVSGQDCFDVDATCLSFAKALHLAAHMVHCGTHRTILIFSSELPSYGIRPQDPIPYSLFGDGAAAMLVGAAPNEAGENAPSHLVAARFQTFPDGGAYSRCRGGGTLTHPHVAPASDASAFFFEMDGPRLFRQVSRHIGPFMQALLADTGIAMSDIHHFVPHQASAQSLEQMCKKLHIPPQRLVRILETHGNQVAASIPTALNSLLHSGKLHKGQLVLLLGAAAGVSLGAVLVRY